MKRYKQDGKGEMYESTSGFWCKWEDVEVLTENFTNTLACANEKIDHMRNDYAMCLAEYVEMKQHIAELKAELNLATDDRWTQCEVDAAKWRGCKMTEEFGWDANTVRKQTAQSIHDMIKPKVWPNNKYIVTTTCDILDKIIKEYNL